MAVPPGGSRPHSRAAAPRTLLSRARLVAGALGMAGNARGLRTPPAPQYESRTEAENSVRATTATRSAGYSPAADARDTMCRRTSFKLEEMSAR